MVDILKTKENIKFDILKLKGVVGIGTNDIEKKLRIYITSKTDDVMKIPGIIGGTEIEFVITEPIVALQRTGRRRPALGGISLGHYKITAGTLGGVVLDKEDNKFKILSNNHVLANSDTIQTSRANANDPILQPGPYDGGINPTDKIALLNKWIKIDEISPVNIVDAALALPINSGDVIQDILEFGKPVGTIDASVAMNVKKSGRTTSVTTGVVADINATVKVSYHSGFAAIYDDQIITTYMAAGGDSGSLLLSIDNKITGLLFAGSDTTTVFNKIKNVINALNLSPTIISPPINLIGLMAVPFIGGVILESVRKKR